VALCSRNFRVSFLSLTRAPAGGCLLPLLLLLLLLRAPDSV